MRPTPPKRWRVLLIAGPSGSGKTTAAQAIGARLGVSVLQADELRLALQRVTTAGSHPVLHRFLDPRADLWSESARYASALRDVAGTVSRAVEPIIEHRVDQPELDRLIIEGDGLLPSLVGHRAGVGAVVVIDRDASTLRSRLADRDRGFGALSSDAQTTAVRGSMEFGGFLAEAASELAVPVIETMPISSLADRILGAVGQGDPR